MKSLELKLDEMTGSTVLKVDMELRLEGLKGIVDIYDQRVLLRFASKATGILEEEFNKLSAPDFLELTFTVRNFLMGLLAAETSEKDLENSTQD